MTQNLRTVNCEPRSTIFVPWWIVDLTNITRSIRDRLFGRGEPDPRTDGDPTQDADSEMNDLRCKMQNLVQSATTNVAVAREARTQIKEIRQRLESSPFPMLESKSRPRTVKRQTKPRRA